MLVKSLINPQIINGYYAILFVHRSSFGKHNFYIVEIFRTIVAVDIFSQHAIICVAHSC